MSPDRWAGAPRRLRPLVEPTDRRGFFRTASGLLVTGSFLAACDSEGPQRAGQLLAYAEKKNEGIERALFQHTSIGSAPASVKSAGGEFPSYHISDSAPLWDEAARGAWRLEVNGLVARPLSLSLDDLRRMPLVTQRVPHFCVEGWTAVAEFTGVRVSSIAQVAGARPDGACVDFASFDDGYHESWDRESSEHPQALIVIAKDGQPLSPAYGAPARVHAPVKLGYKNTKYLTTITYMPERNGGYWTDKGYEWYGGT